MDTTRNKKKNESALVLEKKDHLINIKSKILSNKNCLGWEKSFDKAIETLPKEDRINTDIAHDVSRSMALRLDTILEKQYEVAKTNIAKEISAGRMAEPNDDKLQQIVTKRVSNLFLLQCFEKEQKIKEQEQELKRKIYDFPIPDDNRKKDLEEYYYKKYENENQYEKRNRKAIAIAKAGSIFKKEKEVYEASKGSAGIALKREGCDYLKEDWVTLQKEKAIKILMERDHFVNGEKLFEKVPQLQLQRQNYR